MIDEVVYFNREVLGISPRYPDKLVNAEKQWLLQALQEEVEELRDAGSVAESVDALIDLIYFALGGLYRHGLLEDDIRGCFTAVHSANLMKKRGVKASRPQDGSVADAVKPEGWKDPVHTIQEILLEALRTPR